MTISLRVNGVEYGGWKTARVTRGIEAVSGTFDLAVSERWANQDQAWPILEEDECAVRLGDEAVITGYVDRRGLSFGAREHTLSVSGRDKTGDLVDSSAVLDKWEFRNISLQTLATRVCAPFGIRVTLHSRLGQAEIPPVARLSIDPGDTAFDVIERACRMVGALPIPDGAGGLVLARPGTARAQTDLVEGQNILSASAEYDTSGRYSSYLVLGQHKGTDAHSGAAAAAIKGRATDANVNRSARTLIIRPEGNVTPAQAEKRAQWEATVRAARSDTVIVTVQGWTQGDGKTLWPVNALVKVKSPFLGVNGSLLITQATYSVDEGGTTTTLSLKNPNAFRPEPVVPKNTEGEHFWKEIARGV